MAIEDSVKASLRYLAGQLSKNEKTIEQAAERIVEIIDKQFNKKYDECFNAEVNKIKEELYKDYPEIRDRAIQREKDGLNKKMENAEELIKKLNEKENEINEIRRNLVQSDPKFFAANHACRLAAEAAGINIKDVYEPGEYSIEVSNNIFSGENTYYYNRKTKEKRQACGSVTEYTKQQLVRTIGAIWSAALGMKQIGGKMVDEDTEKGSKQ